MVYAAEKPFPTLSTIPEFAGMNILNRAFSQQTDAGFCDKSDIRRTLGFALSCAFSAQTQRSSSCSGAVALSSPDHREPGCAEARR